jgi:hypothetical protein
MEPKSILMFLVIIILVIVILKYIMSDGNTLSSLTSGKSSQTIDPSELESSSSGNTSNFTYSIWFFIDDWNYKYGEPKVIFGRMSTTDIKSPCPTVVLSPLQNNIEVSLAVYPGVDDENTDNSTVETVVHTCGIANVPIQKWCNLLVSVYGRTLDLYLDGKMVRTCVLPGIAKIDSNAPVYITPTGGFSGWTARFQYWADSSNPQKAWDIYKAGYGGSLLGSIFGKYTVKLSLMEGDTESTSFEF